MRLYENHPFAQAEAPNALHHHGNKFCCDLRTRKHCARPSDKPCAESEIPKIEQHKQENASPKVARSLERDVSVHEEVVRTRTRDSNAIGNARCQPERLQNKEYTEFNERLRQRNAAIRENLTNNARHNCPSSFLNSPLKTGSECSPSKTGVE